MNENQPKDPRFWLNIGETNLECTPENTMAYLHENPKHDYLFFIVSQDEETMQGHHIFRSKLKEQFDIILARMERDGYNIIEEDGLVDGDLRAYYRQHPEEYPTQEVSQRGENKIAFLKYILDKELLIADDFNGNSELYI
jgi:hypothetical protein